MKKYLFLIFIFFIACNKENVFDSASIVNEDENIKITSDNFVSKIEASDVSNLFFSTLLNKTENNELNTRLSNENNTKTIKTIETMY